MQRFNTAGEKLGAETLVNTTVIGDQSVPQCAASPDGTFWVVWTDTSDAGGQGTDLRFRRFFADGTPRDTNDRVVAGLAGTQSQPSLAFQSTGMLVIAFDNGDNLDVVRMDEVAGQIGSVITFDTSGNSRDNTVAVLADDRIVAVWRDSMTDSIKMRISSSTGAAFSATVDVSNLPPATGLEHFFPTVMAMDNGGFVVAWQDNSRVFPDTNGAAIHAQLFSVSGTEIGTEFVVNSFVTGSQLGPQIVSMSGGGFAMIYASNSDVRGQLFDALGARLGSEFLVNTNLSDIQQVVSVAVLEDGRLAVTFDDRGNVGDEDDFGITLQIIDPRDGIVFGTSSSDTLLGHDGVADEINGFSGADTIDGMGGNDTLYGSAGGDVCIGGLGDDILYGGENNDTLLGGLGNDRLDTDSMAGGAGWDFYVVDDITDIVDESEAGSDGTDTVQSRISFSLADNANVRGVVENVSLLGTAAINATGNGLANTLWGNAGANILDGLAGLDIMRGRGGDDTYRIDVAGDIVDEADGGGGSDTVEAAFSLSLTANANILGLVENITLLGGPISTRPATLRPTG